MLRQALTSAFRSNGSSSSTMSKRFFTRNCTILQKDEEKTQDATAANAEHLEEEKQEEVVDAVAAEIAELKEKNSQLNDRLLRALADTENVRRISRTDVMNAKEYSISKFAKSLLDVADNLKRAHESIVVEELQPHQDNTNTIKSLHEGVVMTEQQLQKVFGQFGIIQTGEIGEKFDPNVHEVLFEYEDHDKEAGTIGQVLKTGYLLNGRVLRSAQVGTIKPPHVELKD